MTVNKNSINFTLPAEWSPEEVWCVAVPIPAHMDYLLTLGGLLEELTYSVNFQRDPTRTGAATVSRTWERALATQPLRVIGCEGDLRLRQNPDNACQLQQSFDGGINWELAFDYSLCGWNFPLADPSWPNPQGDAHANLINTYMEIIECVVNNPEDRQAGIDCIIAAAQPLAPGVSLLGPASQLYDRLVSDPELDKYLNHCEWENHRQCFEDNIDVLAPDAGVQFAHALILCLDIVGDEIYNAIHDFVMWLGGDFLRAVMFAGGGGTSYSDDCPWEHDFDFTTGKHGWEIVPIWDGNPGDGEYLTGQGFHATAVPTVPSIKAVNFYYPTVGANITGTQYRYTQTVDAGSAIRTTQVLSDIDSGTAVIESSDIRPNADVTNDERNFSSISDFEPPNMHIYASISNAAGREVYITGLTIQGTGPDPFV